MSKKLKYNEGTCCFMFGHSTSLCYCNIYGSPFLPFAKKKLSFVCIINFFSHYYDSVSHKCEIKNPKYTIASHNFDLAFIDTIDLKPNAS